ncbi:hypothetical protein RCG23_03495 [Neobacillus sp. PS3-34]|uniref:hypothetical protein n=1 Tax=Neobacillus sp. PS3-34 TaxID=3070678 RepID=UPI0027E1CCCA|nr:hypothetical protein [Neobacillus sp. PS3-34]WML49169.1 hypothetical protein RCG23_03495 [Neobacillus sp. PS3-34]
MREWNDKEECILLKAILKYPNESHIEIARRIQDKLPNRSFSAIEQRIGWYRNPLNFTV